jgi:SOS response regulatory protein OraA/RecX
LRNQPFTFWPNAITAGKRCVANWRRKGFAAEEIEKILNRLTRRGVLDDFRYAQRLAFFLTREKLFGPQRVSQKLFQKGIPENLAREAIGIAEKDMGTSERLRSVLKSRLKGRGLEQISAQERRKLANSLRQRGFLWEDIREIFQEAGVFAEEL